MRANALVARRKQRRVRTTDSRHTEPIAANELARNFQTDAPNQVWVTDITYLPTRQGWLYLAVVLDLYARRVVGCRVDVSLERSLVIGALQSALDRRQPSAGLLHHSDRGSQYASADYQAVLAKGEMRPSMSRKGNCWDNAVVESFFASLKAEMSVEVFDSHAHARSCVFDTSSGSTIVSAVIQHWPISRPLNTSNAGLSSKKLHSPLSTKAGQAQ